MSLPDETSWGEVVVRALQAVERRTRTVEHRDVRLRSAPVTDSDMRLQPDETIVVDFAHNRLTLRDRRGAERTVTGRISIPVAGPTPNYFDS